MAAGLLNILMTTTKNCPYCDELISINAIKCKHCGSMLSNNSSSNENLDPFTFTKISLSTKYDVISEIGRGGMATVYKAVQKNLQRTVALKVIHQNLIHDKEFLERFHSESRLAASLSHQSIVSIIDEGIENGIHFIAMEYLDGEDLHKIIKNKGILSIDATVRIISTIADALDYIHKRGLIHRDIKTSNIILLNDGRAVLTDFGIARAISGSKLSQTGSVLGTPEYMSPEQADGIGAEPRSDLYSLGVVMYECLTGTVPFSGDNPVATIYKIINSPHLPVKKINPQVPDWLQTISDKSLSKNINNRFSSGKEFASSLRERRKILLTDKQNLFPRTQKLNIKKINQEIKFNDRFDKRYQNKINTKISGSINKNKFKLTYFIGGTIIILLIVIALLIYKSNNLTSESIVELIKDPEWITLNEDKKTNILGLIESGDKLYESAYLLQPKGNNAFEKYKEVLKIHSTNNYAILQLDKIFKDVCNEVSKNLEKNKIEEATSLLTKIDEFFPERTSELDELKQRNSEFLSLNETGQLFSKNDLTIEELSYIYLKMSTVLNKDPQNKIAKDNLNHLENRYNQLGDSYFNSNKIQIASQVFKQALEYYPNNSSFKSRYEECRNRIEQASAVIVPDIIGINVEEASAKISNTGLQVHAIPVTRTGVSGLVTKQNPSGGTGVRRGTSVTITYIK